MATDVTVPTLGESITEATLGQWLKMPGDAVKADEPALEITAPPATVSEPLVLTLTVHASAIPAGYDSSRLGVSRDGVAIDGDLLGHGSRGLRGRASSHRPPTGRPSR